MHHLNIPISKIDQRLHIQDSKQFVTLDFLIFIPLIDPYSIHFNIIIIIPYHLSYVLIDLLALNAHFSFFIILQLPLTTYLSHTFTKSMFTNYPQSNFLGLTLQIFLS